METIEELYALAVNERGWRKRSNGNYVTLGNGVTLEKSPTYITGSRNVVSIISADLIQIGCIGKPLTWWLENRIACGEREGYTPAQIEEYRLYLELAEKIIGSTIKL